MAEASVRELRNQADKILDRVAAGEPVTITRDGTPIARLERQDVDGILDP